MKLTRIERWILANQCEILTALLPQDRDVWDTRRRILERGYELNYDWEAKSIADDDEILGEQECREVMDILDMYRALRRYFEIMPDKTREAEKQIRFHGFDGNHETKQRGYALFLHDQQGLWDDLYYVEGDLNSHRSTLATYRRMLTEWRSSSEPSALTQSDFERIIAESR